MELHYKTSKQYWALVMITTIREILSPYTGIPPTVENSTISKESHSLGPKDYRKLIFLKIFDRYLCQIEIEINVESLYVVSHCVVLAIEYQVPIKLFSADGTSAIKTSLMFCKTMTFSFTAVCTHLIWWSELPLGVTKKIRQKKVLIHQ